MNKLLVIFCTGTCDDKLRKLVEEHGVHAYTEVPDLMGSGVTGKHFGVRAFPGASAMIIMAVDAAKAQEVMAAVAEFSKHCLPEQGVRAIMLPVEGMV